MARDPLLVLQAVRRRAVEQARVTLAIRVQAEAEALHRIGICEDAAVRDRDAAGALPEAFRFLDMFAGRQASVRMDRRHATAELVAAEASSAEGRTAVASAQAAAEAVEQLIGERAAADRADAAAREQHALDDISRPRASPR